MKVLHVIPSLSRLRGGPSFVVRTLAAHQARAGAEVHIATTDDDERGRQKVPLGTPLWNHGVVYWYFGRTTRTYGSSVGLLSWLLRHTADFDVVHIHSVFTFPATVAAAIARFRSVPYVVRPLGVLNRWGLGSGRTWAKRLSLRLIENSILRGAAAVQFSSAAEHAESAEACRFERGAVIPNPVDFGRESARGVFRAAHPETANRPIVLFVARLDRVKGLELLLDAFRSVRKSCPEAVLVVAGSGDAAYEKTLHERSAGLDVVWTGFLDPPGKAAALADADVFVAPSQSESFGLAAVEALAAGVPTVLTEGVGIAGEVAASGSGIVVPAQADALAEAITRVLGDAELAARLSSQGAELAQSRYRSEAVAAQVTRLYEEIGGR